MRALDLDEGERLWGPAFAADGKMRPAIDWARESVPALISRLRAADRVVKAAVEAKAVDAIWEVHGEYCMSRDHCDCEAIAGELESALAAYNAECEEQT